MIAYLALGLLFGVVGVLFDAWQRGKREEAREHAEAVYDWERNNGRPFPGCDKVDMTMFLAHLPENDRELMRVFEEENRGR